MAISDSRYRSQHETLFQISSLFLTTRNLEETLNQLRSIMAQGIDYPLGSIGLYDPVTQTIKWYGWGAHHDNPPPHLCKLNQAATGPVILTGKPMVRITEDGNLAAPGDSRILRTIIAVPMLLNGSVTGVIAVADHIPRIDAQELVSTMEIIANHLALEIARKKAETETHHLLAELTLANQRMQALSRQLLEIQESERRSLALELHDQMGQTLNSIKMSLDMIRANQDENSDIHRIRAQALVSSLIQQVKKVSFNLRPAMLDDMGLDAALTWLYRDIQTGSEHILHYSHQGLETRFDPAVETAVFRICQEALNNAWRHSDSKEVWVQIQAESNNIRMKIIDKGNGFLLDELTQVKSTNGISGMQERARIVGGTFYLESKPGQGTKIEVCIPLNKAQG